MNPLIYLVAAIAIATAGFAGGHRVGTNAQKVADQSEFDRINNEITEQKAVANAAYRKFQENNLAVLVERDALKTKLQKEKQTNVETINALRARYANVGLRYSTGQVAGLGDVSNGPVLGTGFAASNSTTVEHELPAAITASLRSIAYDCDALSADYRLLYEWANHAAIKAGSK